MNRPTLIRIVAVATGLMLLTLALEWRDAQPTREKPRAALDRMALVPAVVLWAWERPERLEFIDPSRLGIAFLAQTVSLRGDQLAVRPRQQTLNVPPGTRLVAVTRIESDRFRPPIFSEVQLNEVAADIAKLSRLPNVVALQVDYDATRSERAFYRLLLFAVRKQLPDSVPLSITALASWCNGDDWLSDLPIDEAIPMLFRMGVEKRQFISRLEAGEIFSARPCLDSAGVATDESVIKLPPLQRLYVFSPKPWSQLAVNHALEIYQK